VGTLPGLLASEREALLSQLMQELNEGSATVGALGRCALDPSDRDRNGQRIE
jgi:hypothetical protein